MQAFSSVRDGTRSVLVVEDDADISASLAELLSSEGYDVSVCANGLDALERMRRGIFPDVILLDLMMPIMDGWQFRVHQKQDPRMATIPVLAISADGTAKAAAIDADIYLRKPFDVAVLLDALKRTFVALAHRKAQVQQAETQRLVALGTLAAGMAHEINNPLTYVIANLELVTQRLEGGPGSADEELKTILAETRGGCERIRLLVRDILLFSRINDVQEGSIDVQRVLDSSANIMSAKIRQRARLVKEYHPVPLVIGNASRIGQVLLNLIVNAVQAIPEGNASMHEVRLVTRTDENGAAIVEVTDTGEGILPEIQSRIFDPFFTTKPVGVGTGLGLSIAHRIVTAMKGAITVHSAGQGTTFRVCLPAQSA